MDHGRPRVGRLARLGPPAAVGLDESSFLAAAPQHPTLLVTGIVDLDTGRLVDVLPACSARAVTDWLGETYFAVNAFDARRRLTVLCEQGYASGNGWLEPVGRWEAPILRWHHTRLTYAATEDTNLVIKNIKRLGFGFGTSTATASGS